ncbi:MAG: hypothetical protein K0R36_59 [Chryseobacterium sp.]|jgi:hypothetical protein|nr:hypothetical protein [Chryseobacterium sp.]MDF2930728.1 hypothetical protein [Chryseobacterium sp.]
MLPKNAIFLTFGQSKFRHEIALPVINEDLAIANDL